MNSKSRKQPKLTIENYKQQLANWKQPYLQNILSATNDFHMKVLNAQKKTSVVQTKRQSLQEQNIRESDSEQSDLNQQAYLESMQKLTNKRKRQVLNELPSQIVTLQQWKPNTQCGFKDYEQLMKSYSDIFQKKQKLKRNKNEKLQDFRIQQWKMVNQLYQELKEQSSPNVSFSEIIQFFQSCQLFYYFYNIHPHRLPNMIKESAKKYDDKFTKPEFFDFFFIDRPTLSEYSFKTERNVQNVCILSSEAWKSIKNIFATLDTFGNLQINIRNFFQKLKSNLSNNFLLTTQAIQFPEINRTYKLQKIIFELENKYKFNEKVQWDELENIIQNFLHIQHPTLDIIYGTKISKTEITKDTNYFLLQPKILALLKNIFELCPKYCGSFVKSSLFAIQLLESNQIKNYLNNATRLYNLNKNQYLPLEKVIKLLSQEAPEYFDLDQMLEYFSIKGVSKPSREFFDKFSECSSSDQDIKQERQQRRLKKVKSMEHLKKLNKNKQKTKNLQHIKPKQFNLHKRTTPTIREMKVQEMIQEKQRLEEIQLNTKFKANSIPAALNPQRYQKYVKKMQKRKQSILNRLSLRRETDQITLQYLKTNTKLFETKKEANDWRLAVSEYKFEPKPVPLHNSQELLQKIQEEKAQRRKMLLEENKKQYLEKYWKNLNTHDKKQMENDSLLEQIQRIEQKQRLKTRKNNHEVPDFEILHKKFEQQLEHRKRKIQPTQIRQFNLTSPSNKSKYRVQFLSPQPRIFKPRSPSPISPSAKNIKTTKKYQDWVSFNQARQAEKQIQLLEKQTEKQERLIKQRNFAKFMRKNLNNCTDNTAVLKNNTAEKLKSFKKYMKSLEKNTENELAQIYSRVLHRPFLFQEIQISNRQKGVEIYNSNTKQKDLPQKIIQIRKEDQVYEYKPGIFDKQSEEFHPIESENLNQSF